MIDTLIAAVSGANAALDMLKRGVAVRDQKVIEDAVGDMTEKLRDVNTNALEAVQDALHSAQEARRLDNRIAELEKEVLALKAAAEDRDLYHLVPLSANSFAYSLRSVPDGAPRHYLCQACYDDGKKVVLQRPGGSAHLECSACKARVTSETLVAETRAATQRQIEAARTRSRNFY